MAELDLKIQLSGELKSTLDELRESLKEFQTQATSLETVFREAMEEFQTLEEQLDTRIDNLERRIEGLENSATLHAEVISSTRTDVEILKSAQLHMDNELGNLDNKVYALEAK